MDHLQPTDRLYTPTESVAEWQNELEGKKYNFMPWIFHPSAFLLKDQLSSSFGKEAYAGSSVILVPEQMGRVHCPQ